MKQNFAKITFENLIKGIKMAKNANLHSAKNAKKDEFYTQLSDIENELKHYKSHFKDKVVYCNCDDPLASNFFKYFFLNFKHLGLKELITTCYKSQNFREFSAEDSPKRAYAIKITRDCEVDTVGEPCEALAEIEKLLSLSLTDSPTQSTETIESFEKNKHKLHTKITPLKPDKPKNIGQSLLPIFEDKDLDNAGDFRSKDCIELLKQSDIIVTNPPFSLFREYVAQLMEFDKKFVIIGNQNAITYKEIFTLIKENKLWLGCSMNGSNRWFGVPKDYPTKDNAAGVKFDENGNKYFFVNGVRWFVNLDYPKRHEVLETIHSYAKTPENYPKYDNYDAINVDKTIEIPLDYDGVMGVPITFLDKYNPEQFEIVALGIVGSIDFTCNKKMEILDKNGNSTGKFTFNAKGTLYRKYNPKIDKAPAFKDCETGELYSSIYARILIKKRKDAQ